MATQYAEADEASLPAVQAEFDRKPRTLWSDAWRQFRRHRLAMFGLVVFSLLAGEHFFGIVGALLAVPAMSVAQSLFLHFRRYALDYGDGDATDSMV